MFTISVARLATLGTAPVPASVPGPRQLSGQTVRAGNRSPDRPPVTTRVSRPAKPVVLKQFRPRNLAGPEPVMIVRR